LAERWESELAEPDQIIHQALRLKIMAKLYASRNEPLEFARLQQMVRATDGNLGSHLATLQKAGYVRLTKDFHRGKPRTRAIITITGGQAFRRHSAYLREIIESAGAGIG
jgi:DNA-binding MarR family transcriptional regulator